MIYISSPHALVYSKNEKITQNLCSLKTIAPWFNKNKNISKNNCEKARLGYGMGR